MTLPTVTFKFLGLIGLLAIIVGIGATVFFFGGFFDVGADHPDPDIVDHRHRLRIRAWCGQAHGPSSKKAASIVTAGPA
jgi:hypothetical protein